MQRVHLSYCVHIAASHVRNLAVYSLLCPFHLLFVLFYLVSKLQFTVKSKHKNQPQVSHFTSYSGVLFIRADILHINSNKRPTSFYVQHLLIFQKVFTLFENVPCYLMAKPARNTTECLNIISQKKGK